MSTKAFDEALDFLPPARTRKGGGFGQTIVSFITALADGRNAEAEYNRQIARGVAPDQAIRRVFDKSFKQ